MFEDDNETTCYGQCRRHDGSIQSVNFARRNGVRVALFSPDVTEPCQPSDGELSAEYLELEDEVTPDLTEVEKRRLLRLVDGLPISELAKEENRSRAAIKYSIRRMILKNPYCEISSRVGVLRNRINQHK